MERFLVPMPLVKRLRRFLQDFAEANELIKGEENPDVFLAEMLVDAVNRYNVIEPSGPGLNLNIQNLPAATSTLIIDEAAARVLTSVSIRMQRNMMQYQDGNTSKQLNDKWQYYNQTISRLRGGDAGSGFDKLAKDSKVAQNCDNAWGAIHTEFFDTAGYTGTDFVTVII